MSRRPIFYCHKRVSLRFGEIKSTQLPAHSLCSNINIILTSDNGLIISLIPTCWQEKTTWNLSCNCIIDPQIPTIPPSTTHTWPQDQNMQMLGAFETCLRHEEPGGRESRRDLLGAWPARRGEGAVSPHHWPSLVSERCRACPLESAAYFCRPWSSRAPLGKVSAAGEEQPGKP